MVDKSPWYESGFDADYPLMQTFEDSITELQALSVELLLNLPSGARILDLCCGYGRHSNVWRKNGFDPVGFDLSLELISSAYKNQPHSCWIRGDIRHLPFPTETFAAATLMFVSFGYFEKTDQDLQVLEEAHRVLAPGGGIYLDIKNPGYLRTHPLPDVSFDMNGTAINESSCTVQTTEGARYEIRRSLQHPGKPIKRYFYSVHLYEPKEIQALLKRAGFSQIRLYGGYDARPLSSKESRIIAIGTKR